MNDQKYKVLESLYNEPNCTVNVIEFLNRNVGSINEVQRFVSELISLGFVRYKDNGTKLNITSSGIYAYETEKEIRMNNLMREKEYKTNKKFQTATLIVSSVTLLATILGIIVSLLWP